MIDVVLPVLDERDALAKVVATLPAGFRPIVVDNGSTDGSGAVARALGVCVVEEPRRGFGAACFAGLVAATSDVVCFMDCDGSLDGANLDAVAHPLRTGVADLVLGRRRATTPRAWPLHARAANAVLARFVRHRCGVAVHDLGPMRAARRADLLGLALVDRRFGWPLEMVLRAASAGWRISEVDVRYAPRIGRSTVTGTLRGSIGTTRDMYRVAREVAAAGVV